jgi:hypothetical protein
LGDRGRGVTPIPDQFQKPTWCKHLRRLLISTMKNSQAMLRLRNGSIADDGGCLWNWFSSVQAAIHNKYKDRTRTAHHSGWDVPFWFAVSSPLLGVLFALLALAMFWR